MDPKHRGQGRGCWTIGSNWPNSAKRREPKPIELDFGCPLPAGESDESGGSSDFEIGESAELTARLTAAVKQAVSVPVGVKLSPTIRRLDRIAVAAQRDGHADFCTAVNTPAGFHIDWENEELYGIETCRRL